MTYPIKLITLFSTDQYNILYAQRENYKSKNSTTNLELFKERCKGDYDLLVHYLNYFLEDDAMTKKYKMDESDKEGWRIFNELSETISCLKYFSEQHT